MLRVHIPRYTACTHVDMHRSTAVCVHTHSYKGSPLQLRGRGAIKYRKPACTGFQDLSKHHSHASARFKIVVPVPRYLVNVGIWSIFFCDLTGPKVFSEIGCYIWNP